MRDRQLRYHLFLSWRPVHIIFGELIMLVGGRVGGVCEGIIMIGVILR